MKLKIATVMILALALATACATVTHTTIPDALSGNAGDAVELDLVFNSTGAVHVPRSPARDLLRFDVCDRNEDCIRVEIIAASSSQVEAVNAGEHLPAGEFVTVRSGELMQVDGRLIVRGAIVSVLRDVEDWPE